MAFPDGWGRRCILVVQSSQVGSGTHPNFPVLLTKDTLPSEMFDHDGSYPALEGGGDIRFSSDEDGLNRLACEIVKFSLDDADNEAEIYVNVPSVSSVGDTTIYIWYDKDGESQPAQDAAYGQHATWNSGYQGVWHFQEAADGTRYDSTENENDLSDNNGVGMVAGKVGNCAEFIHTNSEYLSISNANQEGLDLNASDYTVTFWMALDVPASNNGVICQKGYQDAPDAYNIGWGWYASAYTLAVRHIDDWSIETEDASGFNSGNTTAGTFYFYSVAYDDSEDDLIFGRNGSYDAADTMTKDVGTNTEPFNVGGTDNYLDGKLDELRVCNVFRAAGYITSEYNNMNNPSTFVIEGTPETPGGGEVKAIAGTAEASSSIDSGLSSSQAFDGLVEASSSLSSDLSKSGVQGLDGIISASSDLSGQATLLGIEYKASDYLETQLLKHVFKVAPFSQPGNIYIALCKSTIEDDDTGSSLPSEISGNNYARKRCNTWSTPSANTISNSISLEFNEASGAWGTVSNFAICDHSSTGNMLVYGKLGFAKTVKIGDILRIDANDLDVALY